MVGIRSRSAETEQPAFMMIVAALLLGCSSSPVGPEAASESDAPEVVVVLPEEVVVQPATTIRFTASVDNSSQVGSVLWSATGGSISSDGSYTAGLEPGSFLVVATAASGAADTSHVSVEQPVPTYLIVQPSQVSLVPATSVEFSADVRYSDGRPADVEVSWQADGGEISSDGVFTAGDSMGVFEVVGLGPEGLADTALVVVDSVPPPVPAAIFINPDAATLDAGDSQTFDADLSDASGAPIGGALVWQAAGGTIDGEGVYQAGATPGEFSVVVETTNGLVDSAAVTILPPANEPPEASFVFTCSDLSCEFDGSSSSDADGTVVSYTWSFGDGAVGNGAQVGHTYSGSGNFVVGLTVTDDADESDTESQMVVVQLDQPDTWIYPGDDIQAAVDAHPAGTSFLITAGVHRLQRVRPKDGNSFTGEPGAVLSGAVLLSSFERDGGLWVATGQTAEGQVHGSCDGDYQDPDGSRYSGCTYPEDLYIDDQPLVQVVSRSAVGQGKWYFDYAADRVYFYDSPEGRKVELSVTRHAFEHTADNVTIRNLIVEKYANPAQHGAIHPADFAPETRRSGWVIEGNEVRWNHGTGIKISNGVRIVGNNVHHNGQLGIGGVGDGAMVEDNVIAFNNTLRFSSGWEAGGTKFARTRDLVVRNNEVYSNDGPGLWTDIDNINTLYEGNIVADNAGAGIFHEISYSAVIRDNHVSGNGFEDGAWMYGAGILVGHSPDVEVYGNTVINNFNGIAGIQQERGSGDHGPYLLKNLWVHDNEVTMDSGKSGVARDTGDNSIFTSWNNRFDRNTYYLGPQARPFEWMNGSRTEAEWQSYGQDPEGVFQR